MILQAPPEPLPTLHVVKRATPRWKRRLDVCGALIVGAALFPLLALTALYIKLVSRGPVLFVQSRVGHGGELFRIFKFRTMHVPRISRDELHRDYVAQHSRLDGPLKKPAYQKELIWGGALLRKLAIDELPQLLNVLRGEMSLVGPRPDVLHLDDYEPSQTRRFEVLPGMTGLWQVSGKNRLTFERMIDLDIEYVETQSLKLDLRIMARTLLVLLRQSSE